MRSDCDHMYLPQPVMPSLQHLSVLMDQTALVIGANVVVNDVVKPEQAEGEVDAIGRFAVWLASDFSDHIVGTTLFIHGDVALFPGMKTGV